MTDAAVYRCADCGRKWAQADYEVGGALHEALDHPCDEASDPEICFDPGFDADDYDVDFDLEGSA